MSLTATILLQIALWPIQLLLILLSPIVFAFVPRSWDHMPAGPLKMWDEWTWGINGDLWWVDPTKKDHPATEDEARSWKWRILWFIRNGNYFDHLWSCDERDIVQLTYTGNPLTSDSPLGSEGELRATAIDKNGRVYECLYRITRTTPGRCKRVYLGYKLKGLVEFAASHGGKLPGQYPVEDEPGGGVLQRVMAWHPRKRFFNVMTKEGL